MSNDHTAYKASLSLSSLCFSNVLLSTLSLWDPEWFARLKRLMLLLVFDMSSLQKFDVSLVGIFQILRLLMFY